MLVEFTPANDAGPLPACTPSLMPFHMSYTGPAPISRYFRPRPAPPSLAALSLRSSSAATVVASSSSTSILSETKSSLTAVSSTTSVGSQAHESECGKDELLTATGSSVEAVDPVERATATRLVTDVVTGMDLETQPASDAASGSSRSSSAQTSATRNVDRFVAAFRGREMYGQAVDVPSGYGGLVLRATLDPKGKSRVAMDTAEPKSKTRGARRRSKRAVSEREGGDDMDPEIDLLPPTRKFTLLSKFSSLMLWTSDRPLDQGRDEYARALVEWTRLATEIHSYDE